MSCLTNLFKKKPLQHADWKNPDFKAMYERAKLDPGRVDEIKSQCHKMIIYKERYQSVSYMVNVLMPWWFVALIHYRESSLRFDGVLHNGDRIIGTGELTSHVPKGRGPFNTWEDAAIDALAMKGFDRHVEWDIANILDKLERYNGRGYRSKGKGEYSPYIAAGTDQHDETGKYWSDGKYKDSAKEGQLGVLALIIGLRDFFGIEVC